MLNNFVLVGRIVDIYDGIVVMNVTRSYKNEFGEYVDDKIELEVGQHIFDNVKEYCKEGDLIGAKGHIEADYNKAILKCEKITFLSTRKDNKEN